MESLGIVCIKGQLRIDRRGEIESARRRERRTGAVDVLGGEQVLTYDDHNNLRTVTDATGSVVTYTYDLLERTLTAQRTTPPEPAASFVYDVRDNLTQVTDPQGQIVQLFYDDLSRLEQVVTADNTVLAGNFCASTVMGLMC